MIDHLPIELVRLILYVVRLDFVENVNVLDCPDFLFNHMMHFQPYLESINIIKRHISDHVIKEVFSRLLSVKRNGFKRMTHYMWHELLLLVASKRSALVPWALQGIAKQLVLRTWRKRDSPTMKLVIDIVASTIKHYPYLASSAMQSMMEFIKRSQPKRINFDDMNKLITILDVWDPENLANLVRRIPDPLLIRYMNVTERSRSHLVAIFKAHPILHSSFRYEWNTISGLDINRMKAVIAAWFDHDATMYDWPCVMLNMIHHPHANKMTFATKKWIAYMFTKCMIGNDVYVYFFYTFYRSIEDDLAEWKMDTVRIKCEILVEISEKRILPFQDKLSFLIDLAYKTLVARKSHMTTARLGCIYDILDDLAYHIENTQKSEKRKKRQMQSTSHAALQGQRV